MANNDGSGDGEFTFQAEDLAVEVPAITPDTWWQDLVETFTPEGRKPLEEASTKLEEAGCPRSVWIEALRDYQSRVALGVEQWNQYAEMFDMAASAVQTLFAEAADTAALLRATYGDELSPFCDDVGQPGSESDRAATLNKWSAACRKEAAKRHGRRSGGKYEDRDRCVDAIISRARGQVLAKEIATLLSAAGDKVSSDSLNMARSRQGKTKKAKVTVTSGVRASRQYQRRGSPGGQ
mgnify:CR=1 FL=1